MKKHKKQKTEIKRANNLQKKIEKKRKIFGKISQKKKKRKILSEEEKFSEEEKNFRKRKEKK